MCGPFSRQSRRLPDRLLPSPDSIALRNRRHFSPRRFCPTSGWGLEEGARLVGVAPHTGADSRNFVYFRTGGHKYLLGSPTMPLTPDYGPQEFVLDMAVSPLDASDLRGFGLGMTRKWTSSHNWRRGDLNHRCEEVCDQRSHQPRRPVFCSTAAGNE